MATLAWEPVSRRLPGSGIALSLALLALVLIGVHEWIVPAEAQADTLCMFRHVTGMPCPTCGTTRSVTAMMRGDVMTALGFNPLMAVVLIGALLVALMRLVAGRRPVLRLARTPRFVAWTLIATLFVVNWVYVIARDG